MQGLTPQDAAIELARLERELQWARIALREDPGTRYQSPGSLPVPGIFRTGVLGALVVMAGLVAVFGFLDGWVVVATVGLVAPRGPSRRRPTWCGGSFCR